MADRIRPAADYIRAKSPLAPKLAVILGSGLGSLASLVEEPVKIPYREIPGFPLTTVAGHEGELIIGTIAGCPLALMNGRFHYYEGYAMAEVTLPVRVFAALGIRDLIVTNAAGGIRADLQPGDIVLLSDQLGFMCPSPLRGPNLDEFGPRFPDMTEVYSRQLIALARKASAKTGVAVKEGVYCFFRGPMYESPAEIRAFRTLGADLVGMSTVPEAIVARHCGMRTLGISLVTNRAAGLGSGELGHAEVMKAAAAAEAALVKLVSAIIAGLAQL